MLDTTRNSFLKCQLSYFALANIRLHKYDSFLRFILLLSGNINVNPSATIVNNESIPLNTLSFYNGELMNRICRPNATVLTITTNVTIPNGRFSNKKLVYFTFEYQ